jgi:hypothetical protein
MISGGMENRCHPAPLSKNRDPVRKGRKIKAKMLAQNGILFLSSKGWGRGKIAGKRFF